eukprot:67962_1
MLSARPIVTVKFNNRSHQTVIKHSNYRKLIALLATKFDVSLNEIKELNFPITEGNRTEMFTADDDDSLSTLLEEKPETIYINYYESQTIVHSRSVPKTPNVLQLDVDVLVSDDSSDYLDELWDNKSVFRMYAQSIYDTIKSVYFKQDDLSTYLHAMERLIDLCMTKELNEYDEISPYTSLTNTSDFLINDTLARLIQVLMYYKKGLSIPSIFAVNRFFRVLMRLYIRCIQLDIQTFDILEMIFGFNSIHHNSNKLSFYDRYRRCDPKLQSYYKQKHAHDSGSTTYNKYYMEDAETPYTVNAHRRKGDKAVKAQRSWLLTQNINFFIESGGMQAVWDRIAHTKTCLYPSDLINLLRPCAQIRGVVKHDYFKTIYVPRFISSLCLFVEHCEGLNGRLNMKILKNMHFMMNHRYTLSEIVDVKSILMQNVCKQKLNYFDAKTIKESAMKLNNASILLVFGFCADLDDYVPVEIVQLCFAFYYDLQASWWNVCESDANIFIDRDTVSRRFGINNKYYNVFGRDIVSFGMHKVWKLKIVRKDDDYWYLCSKIGIANINMNVAGKAFCDPQNDGYGFKLKDGNLYCSDSYKALDTLSYTGLRGMQVNVGDIVVIELDLRITQYDKHCSSGRDVGKLVFSIIQTKKGRKKKKHQTRIDLGEADTIRDIDAYKQYRLAVALDRRESIQLLSE